MLPSVQKGLALEQKMCDAHGIPRLPHAPEERMRSILAYRNDRRLFKRKCDMSGEMMISSYHQDATFPVIKSSLWWGDGWDGMQCGIVPDPAESFFRQFSALQSAVPREGTSVVNSDNCEYNSHTRDSKNGYLNHLSAKCENLLYCYWSVGGTDCTDCIYDTDCTLCFDCGYMKQCYECVKCEEASNCSDCYFSYQLRGCSNCILCSNLIGKKYHYRNQPCTPEEFARLKASMLDGETASYGGACAEYDAMKGSAPQRAVHALNCEDVTGEHLTDCRHCYHCFDVHSSEDCFNSCNGGSNDVIHGYSTLMPPSQTVYCCVTIRGCQNIFFSANCWNSNDLWYCDNCVNCADCFGCVGIKKKRHCFFNVQYSPAEYEALVKQWRERMMQLGEWGEFFPMRYSPFCYNESAAQDFFPLTRDEISARELRYREFDDAIARDSAAVKGIVPLKRERDVREGMILACPSCGLRYRVVQKEIDFYRKMKVPPSQQCLDCRLTAKLSGRTPYSLLERTCSGCATPIETAVSAERAGVILCDACFLARCA